MKIYVGNLVMGSWEKSPDYFYFFPLVKQEARLST